MPEALPTPAPFTFGDGDLATLLCDILDAEELPLPGPAKQAYVVARACARRAASPPPIWIWLLMELLKNLIPLLLDTLKKKYGDDWPAKTAESIRRGVPPWHK